MEKQPCDQILIKQLEDLSVRNYNARRRQGIHTVGQLISVLQQGREHLRTERFNETYLEEIIDALIKEGCLPNNLPDDVYFPTFEHRLRWLAKTQLANGSWQNDIEHSTAAVLSFVRAGYTSTEGEYSPAVDLGMQWLKGHQYLAKDTVLYAVKRTFAEHDGTDYPPMTLQEPTLPLEVLRQDALLRGKAILINYSEYGVWYPGIYTPLELAWMSVGEPKNPLSA